MLLISTRVLVILGVMKLGSIRELSGNKPVLKDPNSSGPDPVYWVFSEVSDSTWANITIITPGFYGGEYPKTFGHYHGVDVDETYHLIEGDGILQLQKKKMVGGKWIENEVEEVFLIRGKPGEDLLITSEYGHSWSNVGKGPLISFDDWKSGHAPSDYEVIQKFQGLAYYLVEENREIKAVPNPKYNNLPEPKWISAAEWATRHKA